jgi:ankyrin repeat protein
MTPLHHAVHQGHLECVRALLEAGADKEAKGYVRPRYPYPPPTLPLPPT